MRYGIFKLPPEELTPDIVRAFLAEAEEEGVNWEAKADDPTKSHDKGRRLHPGQIRAAVCGLANQVGGTVIIGAYREAGPWSLPGIERPRDEPELWLDQVLDGLRPRPRLRRRAWTVESDRVAAVIEVEPLTQTPCMTADGQVFERVSSETIRVKEPARLQELINRGEDARARGGGR